MVANWFSELEFSSRGLTVKQTGHPFPVSIGTAIDGTKWLHYFAHLKLQKRTTTQPLKICFYPHTARPWYFSWAVSKYLGAEFVCQPEDADVVWYFEDSTECVHDLDVSVGKLAINARCTDVSKSHIAKIFAKTFGYDLSVDPETYEGPIVVKSEINGAHDGRIENGPTPRDDSLVYQRLIDNRIDDGLVEDLRTTIIGGKPVLVFRKQRAEASRFENANANVLLADLHDVFTAKEIETIAAFADGIGMDAGGLDVLRDASTGALFIVDANKTDMGPPLALPLNEKMHATSKMAAALGEFIRNSSSQSPTIPDLSLDTPTDSKVAYTI